MTGLTYPSAAPTVSGDSVTVHAGMKNPAVLARKLRALAANKYIADAILKGRYQAQGGAVIFESPDTIFSGEDPEPVGPGSSYPIVNLPGGSAALATVTNWGQDAIVTDTAIARQLRTPVDRALNRLVNQNVKKIDGVALGVVTSQLPAGTASPATWDTATADQILKSVAIPKATIGATGDGWNADTVVVTDLAWTYAMLAFVKAGYTPRESLDTPALTGNFPVIDGMTWLHSPNAITGTALVLDTENLGGMADEKQDAPGYVSAGGDQTAPVEVKVIRDEDHDRYKVRARRITVPVVLEPTAGLKVSGVGF